VRRFVVLLVALLGCRDWGSLSSAYGGSGSSACVAFVVSGDTHTCARKTDGTLVCWGDNRFGQLGTGDMSAHPTPTPVELSGPGVAKVYLPTGVGDTSADLAVFTCALRTDNSLSCWGDNRSGQLGTGGTEQHLLPNAVMMLGTKVSRASNGAGFVCAETSDAALWCWGNNQRGQLGMAGGGMQTVPVQVPGVSGIDGIACGGSHTCVHKPDSTVYCWGDNTYGQLGVMGMGSVPTPTQVSSLGMTVTKVAAGANHTCAVAASGALSCWGDNRSGQLGTNDTNPRMVPTPVDATNVGNKVSSVLAGGSFTCAVLTDSTLWCWGGNQFGQLGVGDTNPRTAPVQVAPSILGNHVQSASAGGDHACAITTDGAVWCWGNDDYGQLGAGMMSSSPVKVLAACK
jgi:alpha-tubulin suppressor-like RCC1 family protein